MHRTRLTVGAVLTAGAVLALATPAFAHVSVDPDQADQGGYSTVNFKVPNERDNASTVELEVHLDPDHPVSSAMPQPVPGWDVVVETTELAEPLEVHGKQITEAPSKITWSGGEIEPGMFQQFPVSLGRLPEDTDQFVFKAIQTYDNGEIVRWIEEPTDDNKEPENPAVILTLLPADGEHEDSALTGDNEADGAADGDTDEASGTPADADTDARRETGKNPVGSDTTARVLGGIGILVGIAGVAFGYFAGRRPSSS